MDELATPILDIPLTFEVTATDPHPQTGGPSSLLQKTGQRSVKDCTVMQLFLTYSQVCVWGGRGGACCVCVLGGGACCVCACVCVHVCVCLHVYVCVCVHMQVCVCMRACVPLSAARLAHVWPCR